MKRPLISTVVFDLDDTLYDCHRQRVLAAHRYAARALLRAGLNQHARRQQSVASLVRLRLRLFREERNLETLDARVVARLGLRGGVAARLARVGNRAYFSYPVQRLHLFPDARPTLRRLHRAGVRIYVLTAGLLRIQRAKVRVLGLNRLAYIHKIYLTGLLQGRGKARYLKRVLRAEPEPRRVLVVGDRADSEIRAARELGLWAVRRLGGEFARFRPRHRLERAHFSIRRLGQLFRLPFQFGPRG
jgi:FMN phosphatase YigB (HAD superfamily)